MQKKEIFAELEKYSLENVVEQLKEDLADIVRFMRVYHTCLNKIDTTFENGQPENIYYFSDNSGGYTAGGIKSSIREFLGSLSAGARQN